MKSLRAFLVLSLAAPALGGCALQMAMAAADLVSNVPHADGASNAQLKPQALQQCTAQAAQYGTPYVIDAEQRRADLIIVWGSVTDAQQHRRSFECDFTNKIKSFKLREIGPSK